MAKYTVDIPQGQIAAKSHRDFVARVSIEMDHWKKIGPFTENDAPQFPQIADWGRGYINLVNNMCVYWSTLHEEVDTMDARRFSERFSEIKEQIERDGNVPPHSASAMGTLCKSLFELGKNQQVLGILAGHLADPLNMKTTFENRRIEQSAFNAYALAVHSFAEALNFDILKKTSKIALRNEAAVASKMIEELGKEIRDLQTDRATLLETISAERQTEAEHYKEIHAKTLQSIKNTLSNSRSAEVDRKQEFDALLEAFNAHLGLKRPVKLWEDEQTEHQKSSKAAWKRFRYGSGLFIVAAFCIAVFAGGYIASTFVPIGCTSEHPELCKGISPKGPLTISMLLAITTVWLWYLRLQMRIHMSERHLALDARERRAFAETYLALLKGEQISRDQESVVLQSLFRPTQDGIVKDDVGPDFGIAGLVAKALDRK